LLEKDNEENAVICLRIILDLHKNFRPHLEAEVQPFLDFVRQIYQNFPSTVNEFFSSIDSAQYAMHHGQAGPSASVGGGSKSGALNKSTESFKVLTECPLIVMFLFQLYPKHLQTNIPVLLPLMVRLWLRCLRQTLTPHRSRRRGLGARSGPCSAEPCRRRFTVSRSRRLPRHSRFTMLRTSTSPQRK
jgi:hypothetical protein